MHSVSKRWQFVLSLNKETSQYQGTPIMLNDLPHKKHINCVNIVREGNEEARI